MTAIVGISNGKRALLGADSETLSGAATVSEATSKLWTWGKIIVGGSGEGPALQAVQYGVTLGNARPPKDPDALTRWLHSIVLPKARAAVDSLPDSDSTWDILIGVHGQIRELDSSGYVLNPSHDYHAIGIGADAACGALFATSQIKNQRARALGALTAAADRNIGVSAPFTFLET